MKWDEALAKVLSEDNDLPRWLTVPRAARILADLLKEGDGSTYRLHRYVIMPNHVHLLVEPLLTADGGRPVALKAITQRLKGASSRLINLALGRSGSFWQYEGYDHWVRDREEHERVILYIDENPVKAGLCRNPQEWLWGSAGE